MTPEIQAIQYALWQAQRAYHDCERWSEEHIDNDPTQPTYSEAIDAALNAADAALQRLRTPSA